MAGETPAVEATPAPASVEADLLEVAAPAEAGKPAAEAAAPITESAPADDKKAGADGEADKGDKPDADLLADDDKGNSDEKADGKTDADKSGAPETYEAFTLPDGIKMDDGLLAKATPVFKSIGEGLKQEDAQKLVTLFAEAQQEAATAQADGFLQIKRDWQAEIKGNPEFGGEHLSKTIGDAMAFLNKFGTPRLKTDLKEWGWANHPDLIIALASAQRAHFSEDTTVHADAAIQTAPKSAAEILWPGMFQSKE